MREVQAAFHTPAVAQAVKKMIDENAELRHQIDSFRREQLASVMENIKKNINDIPTDNGAILYVKEVKAPSALLRDLVFPLKAEVPNVVLIIGVKDGDKATLCVAVGDEIVARGVNAGEIVRAAAKEINGGGGGQPFFATAGGKNPDGMDKALAVAAGMVKEKLSK